MTVPLSPGSPRRAAAKRFGSELRKAMKRTGVGQGHLAASLGIGESAIRNWLAGNNLPRLDSAQLLAAGLTAPILVDIVLEAREGACEGCGKRYVNEGGGPKRFCSNECRDIAEKIRTAKGDTRSRATVAERRLRDHMAAVDAMCRGCEPEGLCRDTECALRPVSPLPVALRANDAQPVQRSLGAWEDRPRMLAVLRQATEDRWARDGERERQSERQRARFAAMTEEQRAKFRESVSRGRRATA
jgi:transcriptional regulator with XRE-family HTH domain